MRLAQALIIALGLGVGGVAGRSLPACYRWLDHSTHWSTWTAFSSGEFWALVCQPGYDARLVANADQVGPRVEQLQAPGGENWRITLYREALTLSPGQAHRLVFRARADRPRDVLVNLGRPTDPIERFSLHQTRQLTPEWTTFDFAIEPTEASSHPRLWFELGQSEAAVEFSDVRLTPLPLTPAPLTTVPPTILPRRP